MGRAKRSKTKNRMKAYFNINSPQRHEEILIAWASSHCCICALASLRERRRSSAAVGKARSHRTMAVPRPSNPRTTKQGWRATLHGCESIHNLGFNIELGESEQPWYSMTYLGFLAKINCISMGQVEKTKIVVEVRS